MSNQATLIVLGRILAPGLSLFGVIWCINGDMDWFANSLDLEHCSSHYMCPWCRANDIDEDNFDLQHRLCQPPLPWNDIRKEAAWRDTVYTSADEWYIEHGGRRGCHPFLALPGVSGLSVMADALHVLDLGLAHHVLGNVLFLLC